MEIKIDSNTTLSKDTKIETKEEIQARLNKIVEDSMVTVSINPVITFENGNNGVFNIYNDNSNKYSQIVKIYNETGSKIYESKTIPVGSKMDKDVLNVVLPKGVYNSIAYIESINNSNELIGKAGVKVKIIIE